MEITQLLNIKKMVQQKLFKDSEIFVKERPKYLTNRQEEKLLQKFALKIINRGYSRSNLGSIMNDIQELEEYEAEEEVDEFLEYYSEANYLSATNIKNIFQEYLSEKNEIERQNILQWIHAHKIRPLFHIGEIVIINSNNQNANLTRGKKLVIENIYFDQAQYLLSDNNHNSFVLDYEILEAIAEKYHNQNKIIEKRIVLEIPETLEGYHSKLFCERPYKIERVETKDTVTWYGYNTNWVKKGNQWFQLIEGKFVECDVPEYEKIFLELEFEQRKTKIM